MKKITITAAILILGSVGAIIAFAQISHKGGPARHFGGVVGHHEKMLEHLTAELKFTDQQKAQAKPIIADAKTRFGPVHEQLKESHRSAADLGTNGVFDEQRSQELATRQAEIIRQALVEKERTKAALFAIMTAEQREQAKQMMNNFVENFGH